MTWTGLVLRNLGRRKMRTALTAAGVALGVALIVALLSLTTGARRTATELIHVGRADFGLFQSGASDLTLSRLPASLAAQIDHVPGVASTGRLFLYVTEPGLVFGLDPNEFPAQRLVIVHGARATGDEALLGDHAAKRLHLGPGSTLRLGRHAFRVAGIYHTGDAFQDDGIVLPLPVVQRLAGRPGDVSTIAVNADLGTPPKALARELERRFVGTTAVTEPGQAVRIDTSSRVIIDSGWIISLLALIVGGIAVANTMAMSVFERVREIGILRAVGWRSGRVAALIASEALGICALGLGAGLLLGYAAAEEFAAYSESGSLLRPTFTPGVFAWGLAFAVGVALVGALYPSWRAVRLTPIEALRRE